MNLLKNKNDDEDISSWTCEHCQSYLKAHKAAQRGNKGELQSRCTLLKKLITCGLQNLMSLSKTELKSMSLQLSLTHSTDTSKDELITNISNAIIDTQPDTSNQMLVLIDNDNELND